MLYFTFTCFTWIVTASCAMVGEFPFHELTDSTTKDDLDPEHTTVDDLEAMENVSRALEIEFNSETHFKEPETWSQEPSPLLQVIRDFLFQARDGLLDPQGVVLKSVTEGPIEERTEEVIKAFERGVIEATTLLVSQVENFVVSTIPTVTDSSFLHTDFLKRTGDVLPDEPTQEKVNLNGLNHNKERQMDQIANMSTSCSNCYNTLQSCVQQCFITTNCNDIERNVRTCPPSPNRLCNPFTPWSPVDECRSNEECKSPLLCCNDGCINKCIAGVLAF